MNPGETDRLTLAVNPSGEIQVPERSNIKQRTSTKFPTVKIRA